MDMLSSVIPGRLDILMKSETIIDSAFPKN